MNPILRHFGASPSSPRSITHPHINPHDHYPHAPSNYTFIPRHFFAVSPCAPFEICSVGSCLSLPFPKYTPLPLLLLFLAGFFDVFFYGLLGFG